MQIYDIQKFTHVKKDRLLVAHCVDIFGFRPKELQFAIQGRKKTVVFKYRETILDYHVYDSTDPDTHYNVRMNF